MTPVRQSQHACSGIDVSIQRPVADLVNYHLYAPGLTIDAVNIVLSIYQQMRWVAQVPACQIRTIKGVAKIGVNQAIRASTD